MAFSRLRKKIFAPRSNSHEPDKSLITAMFILVVFGLVMLFSASSVVSYSRYANTYHYFIRQFVWVLLSLGVFWVASRIDYRILKKFAVEPRLEEHIPLIPSSKKRLTKQSVCLRIPLQRKRGGRSV